MVRMMVIYSLGGLIGQMATPTGPVTIKFDSDIYNKLSFLIALVFCHLLEHIEAQHLFID